MSVPIAAAVSREIQAGKPVAGIADLRRLIRKAEVGGVAVLDVLRGGEVVRMEVRITEQPEQARRRE